MADQPGKYRGHQGHRRACLGPDHPDRPEIEELVQRPSETNYQEEAQRGRVQPRHHLGGIGPDADERNRYDEHRDVQMQRHELWIVAFAEINRDGGERSEEPNHDGNDNDPVPRREVASFHQSHADGRDRDDRPEDPPDGAAAHHEIDPGHPEGSHAGQRERVARGYSLKRKIERRQIDDGRQVPRQDPRVTPLPPFASGQEGHDREGKAENGPSQECHIPAFLPERMNRDP